MSRHGYVTKELIGAAIQASPRVAGSGTIRGYEAFYLGSRQLEECGITVRPENVCRPVLLLAGTSIPMSDRVDLVISLVEEGFEVASISNKIGGLLDVGINPKKDRVDSLRHYLGYLIDSAGVAGVDIIAQSYSAFEVVRLLLEDPERYKGAVRSITLLNPPGFNDNTGVVRHCSRFCWHHVLKGYSSAVKMLLNNKTERSGKKYARREIGAISTWGYKSVKNPVRTMKEVLDIVSFKLKPHLVRLQNEFNYDINILLQSDDQILPVEITLGKIRGVIPAANIKVVPGGHNDMFFQRWQRKALIDFITEIRSRRPAGQPPLS